MKTSSALVKLIVFMVVTSFLTFTLAATIGNLSFGGKTKYAATFSDVTGLLPGNDIRIAGVKVGAVEGIELQGQLDSVTGLQCDIGQGYFFAPPLDAAAMRDLLNGGDVPPAPHKLPDDADRARREATSHS